VDRCPRCGQLLGDEKLTDEDEKVLGMVTRNLSKGQNSQISDMLVNQINEWRKELDGKVE
jgi:hypothetical protein